VVGVGLSQYTVLGVLVFLLGALGLVIRKNAIVMFLCLELMLNGVNILFMALARARGNVEGQVIVLFVMAVAAAEAAIGMAVITSFYRNRGGVDVDRADLMKW
jgi:NADH-quinone oxidoreductase subunit K